MTGFLKQYKLVFAILAALLAINVLLFFYSPNDIVQAIGAENSYFVLFLIAVIGGLSSFTGTIYFAAVATFSSGGSVPWLLGLAGGIGLTISDTVFFTLAKKGSESIDLSSRPWVKKAMVKLERMPKAAQYAAIYSYISFTPLPNDLLMVALAVLGFRYRSVIWLILAGSITITTLVAYLGNFWQ